MKSAIVWENGADLDPDVLYLIVFGQPISNYTIGMSISFGKYGYCLYYVVSDDVLIPQVMHGREPSPY